MHPAPLAFPWPCPAIAQRHRLRRRGKVRSQRGRGSHFDLFAESEEPAAQLQCSGDYRAQAHVVSVDRFQPLIRGERRLVQMYRRRGVEDHV